MYSIYKSLTKLQLITVIYYIYILMSYNVQKN